MNDLAARIAGGGELELAERQEGDLPRHLLLVHYGQDLRCSLVAVHYQVKQPETMEREVDSVRTMRVVHTN